MKNMASSTLIGFLISSYIFSTVSSADFSFVQSFDDLTIRSKFEPWLWEKVQELEANGTTRFMSIGLGINCTSYEHNLTAAYNFKTQVATHLAQEHNATIIYIGKVLSFIDIKIRVPEIKEIAKYEFIDRLGDGEARGIADLDISTVVIRSTIVVNELGYNGSDIRVAVLDSGINASHPDFAGKDITWRDFINNQPTSYDDEGHGTHCAGIVAGTGNASNGIYRGVAPGVTRLIIGKMLDQSLVFREPDARAALDWAVSEGAQVISCSWSIYRWGGCDGHCLLCEKADECVSKGVVVVKSAGNAGELGPIGCPGNAFNVITVGAIDDHDTQNIHDDTLLDSSSRGPTQDGRPKPDVVAPGWNIMSPNATTGGYSNFGYTSAATPHVAGVAALLLQAHPGWTPGIVKSVIMGTARLNDNLQAMPQRENDRGKGIVDAERAVLCPTDIPVDQAESKHEYGYGDYTAWASLSGWYDLSAGRKEGVDPVENYAITTLNKNFVPSRNLTNPKFLFGFHDKGYMNTPHGWADLRAIFKLFAPNGSLLFMLNSQIHYENGTTSRYFDDYYTIDYTYHGTLLAQQTYTIEYGFSTYAYQAYSDFDWLDRGAQALAITILGIVGVGNPSFEERLKSVYEPAYWDWSDVDKDWRELKGDITGPEGVPDRKVDMRDVYIVNKAYGSKPGDPNWNPDADLNGDDKVDMKDMYIVTREFGKVTDPVDGSYSWYTHGNGTYNMTQWLCDLDIRALRDQQVTFSFWFKPNATENKAQAKITYITETGDETTVNGDWVYATEGWHNANVTTTLPANTMAIKVIIHFTDNFQTWIDKASIDIS